MKIVCSRSFAIEDIQYKGGKEVEGLFLYILIQKPVPTHTAHV
jgi:hypothetical protein